MSVLAGRYRLLELVGEGGMGVVWRAHDERLERDVAIKLLRPIVAGEQELRRRFDREARMLAGLTSEHIVRVFDYVNADEQPFLVMEYVAGGNLAQTTFGTLPLPVAQAALFARPVALALAYAHARGVIHRDLTPSNILVEDGSGRVLTGDFGLARIARSTGSLTAAGVLMGTPEYWSPELALGRETDAAADMYALGCILFQLLTGHLPFEGADRLAVGLRRAHEAAPSLASQLHGAPIGAIALVDALLAHDPSRRPDAFSTVAALGDVASGAWPSRLPTIAPVQTPATIALPSERETVVVASSPSMPSVATVATGRRRRRRRSLASVAIAAAATSGIVVMLFVAAQLGNGPLHAPNVVSLRERVARERILATLPYATVSIRRVYSLRAAAGRVLRQQPQPDSQATTDEHVRLTVSKGTPFAPVPVVAAGSTPATARASLLHRGFRGRYVYAPSWTVRKGTLIAFEPSAGTRVRRPASVQIVVSSGYPRAIVPKVGGGDLASAQTRLADAHLRYHVVYRLAPSLPANEVLDEVPAGGASVYQGTEIRLTVARQPQWVKLFLAAGSGPYESAPFTAPAHWQIRYRLTGGEFGIAFAQFTWAPVGSFFGGDGFVAHRPGVLHTYTASDGAGSYRLVINPFAGTGWYVEVDALK